MKLIVLGSSSLGNTYILTTGSDTLMIEAGVRFREVKIALDFNIGTIQGCIVSHEHGDHSKYMNDYLDAGIPVLASQDTFEAKKVKHPMARIVKASKGYIVGKFRVMPFELKHDVTTLGYMVDHPAMGRLIFITDTYLCEYKFSRVNHWLIEANYSDEILERNISNGSLHPSMRNRLLFSHMEIQTTKDYLLANDLSNTDSIVLIHLSDGNSHAEQFKAIISSATGIPTHIGDKGLKIDLNNDFTG